MRERGGGRGSHCNTTREWTEQVRLAFENRKQVKRVISKDLYESTEVVFKEKNQHSEGTYWKAVLNAFSVPLCSLIFSTAGRVFLRGITDTADVTSPFRLPTDWGLPHGTSDPWLGLGGLGGGAQEDSELEGVKAL